MLYIYILSFFCSNQSFFGFYILYSDNNKDRHGHACTEDDSDYLTSWRGPGHPCMVCFFHFFFSLTNVFFFVSKGEGEMIRWIINVQVALFF